MSAADYLIDSALVLLVLIQIKERKLTTISLIRQFVIAGIAVLIYLRGIPAGGNDLVLLAVAAAAGLLVRTIDLTGRAPHPQFQTKLEGIGFGFLVPVFFITTGVQFDARTLFSHPAAIAEIPLFLAALLIVRGTPALLYARRFGKRRAGVAGLMQATSLTFVIVATQIGTATGQISQTTAAALLAAGLLSAALFPAAALKLLTIATPGAQADLSRSGGMTTPICMPEAEPARSAAERQPAAIAPQGDD